MSFNQLVIPLLFTLFIALCLLTLYLKVRQENQRKAQQARQAALGPPAKGRNHRSLPWRRYYLTHDMAKPTPADELLLKAMKRLQPPGASLKK